MIHLSASERFLCCGISGDRAWQQAGLMPMLRAIGEDEAWDVAELNGVASIVGTALLRAAGADVLRRPWATAASETRVRIDAYMAQLDRIASVLADRGVTCVALKNAGIARALEPDRSLSPMGDIDLLINPSDFEKAHAALIAAGARVRSRGPFVEASLEETRRSGGLEYEIALPDGATMWLELQWRPVAGRWINEEQEPPAVELIERSVAISGSAARLLSPEDNLLQVCLHTAKHSYVRAPGFRLHTDVDRITRQCELDWPAFCALVERLQVKTAVYFSLYLAACLLRSPVPAGVLTRLQPARWRVRAIRSLLLSAGLFVPDAHKWGRFGYLAFNALLYDDIGDLRRSVFPSPAWMARRYELRSGWLLPYYYVRRLADLAFNRAST